VSDGTPAAIYLLGVRRREAHQDTEGPRQGTETFIKAGRSWSPTSWPPQNKSGQP